MKNLVTVIIILIGILIKGSCLYFLWNIVAPIICLGPISYWDSLLVMLLATIILFKVNIKWTKE